MIKNKMECALAIQKTITEYKDGLISSLIMKVKYPVYKKISKNQTMHSEESTLLISYSEYYIEADNNSVNQVDKYFSKDELNEKQQIVNVVDEEKRKRKNKIEMINLVSSNRNEVHQFYINISLDSHLYYILLCHL